LACPTIGPNSRPLLCFASPALTHICAQHLQRSPSIFILVAKLTHAPRHSSRRLVLNRSASRLALGLVKRSAASGLGCGHSASGTPRPASAARGCKALSRPQHAVSEAQLLWRSAARGSRRCPVVPRPPRCLIPPALSRVGIQPDCTRPLWSSGTPATGQVFSHSGR